MVLSITISSCHKQKIWLHSNNFTTKPSTDERQSESVGALNKVANNGSNYAWLQSGRSRHLQLTRAWLRGCPVKYCKLNQFFRDRPCHSVVFINASMFIILLDAVRCWGWCLLLEDWFEIWDLDWCTMILIRYLQSVRCSYVLQMRTGKKVRKNGFQINTQKVMALPEWRINLGGITHHQLTYCTSNSMWTTTSTSVMMKISATMINPGT